jgi:hypothetical protein
MSIIVPFPARILEIQDLQYKYKDVFFLSVDDPTANTGPGADHLHFDVLRSYGLGIANGDIIALVEDQETFGQNWAVKMLEAHDLDFAVIGGAIENGVNRPLNWSVYFCDFLKYQNPIIIGESLYASDVNVSYKRGVLESVRSSWQEGFHEPIVHREILSQGWKIGLNPEAIAYQMRSGLDFGSVLKERFIWARHYAAKRQRDFPKWKALVYSVFSAFLPLILLFRKTHTIIKKRRNIGIYFRVLPLTIILIVFWSAGEMAGYFTGKS